MLPNEHGQVWREYDISPYTLRVRDVAKPEQAIIDWVLRETGTEVWFAEPLGILNASSTTLRVYHTPEMQERVRGDRRAVRRRRRRGARARRAADDGRQPELAGAGRSRCSSRSM